MPSSSVIDEETLSRNVKWHLVLIAVQIGHAKRKRGRARSGYYKLAMLLSASVVEALVHALLVKKLGANGVLFTGRKETFEHTPLPRKFFRDSDEVVICKRREEILPLSRNPEFVLLNKACFTQGVFQKRLFNKVETVRKMRNKIHIQGLKFIDRRYTEGEVKRISTIIDELLVALNEG